MNLNFTEAHLQLKHVLAHVHATFKNKINCDALQPWLQQHMF